MLCPDKIAVLFSTKWPALYLFLAAVLAVYGPARCDLDGDRYIPLDQVRPGMEAWCLTTYSGQTIEKFDLEVKSVIRNFGAGRDAILVQGTDQRFIHTGPVAGCSGSPVYIEGRLAGALAFGWSFSKDPLYGVTPIADMLEVGSGEHDGPQPRLPLDFSLPFDPSAVYQAATEPEAFAALTPGGAAVGGMPGALPNLLAVSGMSPEVCLRYAGGLGELGLVPVAGGGMVESGMGLAPGSPLAVPLVWGDMDMTVIGTVTEVVGDRVYGFGHSFLGYGPVNLPMATGKVHTVVSSLARSFKLASSGQVVGAVTADQSSAVFGRIGAEARTIPLSITVDRFDAQRTRSYKCLMVDNKLFTPLVFNMALAGAASYLGGLPPEHYLEYRGVINAEGVEPIVFENVSTGAGLMELLADAVSPVAALMNNPYSPVRLQSVEVYVNQQFRSAAARIKEVRLADSIVEPGELIEIQAVVEPLRSPSLTFDMALAVPRTLRPGQYNLIVCGSEGYSQFLRQAVPHRYVPTDLSSLVDVINQTLSQKRNGLYCILVLPPDGVAVERGELPGLPSSMALLLQDPKRTVSGRPQACWLLNTAATELVVADEKILQITVEK